MKLEILLAILAVAGLVISYSLVERRLNQRPCGKCGFRVSVDDPAGRCPRCGSNIPAGGPDEPAT